jgi:hypothetical protein
MKVRALPVVILALLPVTAQADQAAAKACASGLSPDGQLLYTKTAPSITPSSDVREALMAVARPMVMNGSLSRDAARAAAEAAGQCLKLLK